MSGSAPGSYFWYREPVQGGMEFAYLCDKIVYSGRSRYQQIDVADTRAHGRMLFLDGVAQSAECDEFIYHEILVHPALFSHPQPRSVLVIGGAEGATLREVLRHPGIERVVMVDIDGELVEICKRHLPSWHQGAYEDPRLQLIIGDARQFVEECSESFESIIVDLSDPLEGSPAVFLFTIEFYQLLAKHLSPQGSISLQGEGISPEEVRLHARMVNTLKTVFPVVHPYPYALHSFHRPDAHILVTADPHWSHQSLVRRIASTGLPLRYFSAEMAEGMFRLPPYLYQAYETFDRILRDDDFRNGKYE